MKIFFKTNANHLTKFWFLNIHVNVHKLEFIYFSWSNNQIFLNYFSLHLHCQTTTGPFHISNYTLRASQIQFSLFTMPRVAEERKLSQTSRHTIHSLYISRLLTLRRLMPCPSVMVVSLDLARVRTSRARSLLSSSVNRLVGGNLSTGLWTPSSRPVIYRMLCAPLIFRAGTGFFSFVKVNSLWIFRCGLY